jgi:hypothetical protein
MLLLSQGCWFIQSLHFSYELQEDSMQNSNQSVQFPWIRPDDMVFRLDAHQPATSVRTMRTFRPDAHQCLEASNSSRLHPFGRNGKSSGCSSKFEKILVFQWIRQDDVSYRSDAQLSKAPIIRTTCHTVQTHIRLKHHPSGRRGFPFGPSSMSRSFELLQLASVRTTLSVRSSFRISFRNTEMERLLQPSGRAHT